MHIYFLKRILKRASTLKKSCQ